MRGEMEVNGVDLNYRIDGPDEAPGVVMGNSLATNFSMWEDQAKVLSKSYRVLRMDKRGHGSSGIGGQEFSIEDLANDVVRLSCELGFEGGHYIGL